MNTAKQVEKELLKVWKKRGWTRGFPLWEQRIALVAIEEFLEAGEHSELLDFVKVRSDHFDSCGEFSSEIFEDLLK